MNNIGKIFKIVIFMFIIIILLKQLVYKYY